ncbi:MAG: hypothetical protein IPP71_08550 [Bacteroidetes bacterium]|nr:hypothetical protein [Bacteroidota bacterium]
MINEIMTIRKNWFETPVSLSKLQEIVETYQQGLFRAITNSIAKFGFYRSPKSESIHQ